MESRLLWSKVQASPFPTRDRIAYVRLQIGQVNIQRNLGRISEKVYHDQIDELAEALRKLKEKEVSRPPKSY